MPVYEYYSDKCKRDVRVTLSISEHNEAKVACPGCGNKALRPLVSTFFSTSQAQEIQVVATPSVPSIWVRQRDRGRAPRRDIEDR